MGVCHCIPMYFNGYIFFIFFIDPNNFCNLEWITGCIFSSQNYNHTMLLNILYRSSIKVFHCLASCIWYSRPNMHFPLVSLRMINAFLFNIYFLVFIWHTLRPMKRSLQKNISICRVWNYVIFLHVKRLPPNNINNIKIVICIFDILFDFFQAWRIINIYIVSTWIFSRPLIAIIITLKHKFDKLGWISEMLNLMHPPILHILTTSYPMKVFSDQSFLYEIYVGR